MDFSLSTFFCSGHVGELLEVEVRESDFTIGSKKKELQIVLLGLIMDLSTIQKPFGLRA